MLKGQKKHIDKEQGKAKHEVPRSVNYRATQNTTALQRSVVYTTGLFKGLSLYKLHPGSRYNSKYKNYIKNSVRIMASMACQTLHHSMFLYFYWTLLHYYCIFWDLYLISGHFYSICSVSFLYSMICIQYIRLFLLYNFRLYCIFSHLHCIFLDLYLISGHFYSILLHYYCIFLDLYLISGHFYYI